MTTHKILEHDGVMYLEGQVMLIQHPEGDYSNVTRDTLIEALYDEYQCSDTIKDGDQFEFEGSIVAYCSGVHVLPSQENN